MKIANFDPERYWQCYLKLQTFRRRFVYSLKHRLLWLVLLAGSGLLWPVSPFFLLTVFVLFLLDCYLARKAGRRFHLKAYQNLTSIVSLELDDRGVTSEATRESLRILWEGVEAVFEGPSIFLLLVFGKRIIMIPKFACEPDQVEAIRDLIVVNMAHEIEPIEKFTRPSFFRPKY